MSRGGEQHAGESLLFLIRVKGMGGGLGGSRASSSSASLNFFLPLLSFFAVFFLFSSSSSSLSSCGLFLLRRPGALSFLPFIFLLSNPTFFLVCLGDAFFLVLVDGPRLRFMGCSFSGRLSALSLFASFLSLRFIFLLSLREASYQPDPNG